MYNNITIIKNKKIKNTVQHVRFVKKLEDITFMGLFAKPELDQPMSWAWARFI